MSPFSNNLFPLIVESIHDGVFTVDCEFEITSFNAAAEAVQIHGAYGYSDEYDVERFMRNAKGAMIYEGSNEIQTLIQAQYALRNRRDKALRCEMPAYDAEAWQVE